MPEIIHLLSEGYTVKEIAAKLGVKVRTLESRIAKFRKATGCRSTVQLCARFYQQRAELYERRLPVVDEARKMIFRWSLEKPGWKKELNTATIRFIVPIKIPGTFDQDFYTVDYDIRKDRIMFQ